VEFPKIVAAARAIQQQYMIDYPVIAIRLVGKLINNNAFRESSLHDITHLVPFAFVLALLRVAVFMWRGSRRWSTAASALFSVLVRSCVFHLDGTGYRLLAEYSDHPTGGQCTLHDSDLGDCRQHSHPDQLLSVPALR